MENTEENLLKLKYEFDSLKQQLFQGGFSSEKELKQFEKNNKNKYDRYYFLLKAIDTMRWELMTPEERAKEEELIRLMKLKREGKLF